MSGSDRSDRTPDLGWFGVWAAFLICAILIGTFSYLQGRETERRYYTPHQHSEDAKHNARKSCFNGEASDPVECVYEAIESSEEHAHSEQDLSAQQRAATSALISMVVGVVTLIVSGAGLWALLKTIRQAQEGLERAREANEISQRGLELGWKPDLAIEMPWPYRERVRTQPGNGIAPYYVLWGLAKITNRSNFPVTIMETHMAVGHDTHGDFAPGIPQEQFYELPALGECYSWRGVLLLPTIDDLPRAKFGIGMVDEADVGRYFMDPPYIYGSVSHRDPLGIIRKTSFAFRPKDWTEMELRRHGGARLNYDEKIKR